MPYRTGQEQLQPNQGLMKASTMGGKAAWFPLSHSRGSTGSRQLWWGLPQTKQCHGEMQEQECLKQDAAQISNKSGKARSQKGTVTTPGIVSARPHIAVIEDWELCTTLAIYQERRQFIRCIMIRHEMVRCPSRDAGKAAQPSRSQARSASLAINIVVEQTSTCYTQRAQH